MARNPQAMRSTPPRPATLGAPAAGGPAPTNSGTPTAGSTPMMSQIPAGKGTISSSPAHDPRIGGHPQAPAGAHSLIPGHAPLGAPMPKLGMNPAVNAGGSGGQMPAGGPRAKVAKGSGTVGRAR